MKVSEFYKACEDILGTKTEYKEQKIYTKYDRETGQPYKPATRATRWGGREPGNGRFPGNGLIRVFGSIIHITLTDPQLSGTFNSFEDALKALEEAVGAEKELPEVGDEIDVYIQGKFIGKGIIADEYDENQWTVDVTIVNSDDSTRKVRRYIDKKA